MIHIPPIDPVLPNFPLLFDGDAMRDLIASRISRTSDAEITACRPTYVRYKPETSCLIAYDLDLRVDGRESTMLAHIRTFADDRGRRRRTNRKLEKLISRAIEECGDLPLDRATYLPELNGILSIFPIDYDLRSLLKIAAPSSVQKRLRQMLNDPGLRLAREPEMIRYKPGRKALFRYEMEEHEHGILYGKIHTDDRAKMIGAATGTLIAAGLPTPEVLGTIPKLGFIAHAEAPGTQLASLRDDPRYSDLLAALTEPLALLHRTPVEGLPVHHLGHEVDRLRETAKLLGVILPAQRHRLHRIVCILEDRLARVDDKLATNHGDFYDDQAIVDQDRIAIIDLDEIRLAHPMLDVGNMLAHLRTGEQRGEVNASSRQSFVDAMRAHRQMDERDIATFEAIGILKLAPGPFRRMEPGWPDAIDGMLGLIEELLGVPVHHKPCRAAEGKRREPLLPGVSEGHILAPETSSGGTSVIDDKLPELPALQDPERMQPLLSDATGNPALDLSGIHIQRHKQGRRAILRYDVAGGEPIWGKIFASKRGPRVHEITRRICAAQAFGPDTALPGPIAFLPELRVLLQRSVPGESIESRLFAGDITLSNAIADASHALHTSGLDLGREHDLDKELSPLQQRVENVGTLFPEMRDDATGLHARILDMAGSVHQWRYVPIHRDFYHDQVLIDGDRLSVLDLDDAAMSEPAVDIANFAAHLDLLALQHPEHAPQIGRVRDRFLAQSRELDPALDDHLLAFLTASTMLRLAGIHAPRKDGERIAAGLIALAKASLGTALESSSGSRYPG